MKLSIYLLFLLIGTAFLSCQNKNEQGQQIKITLADPVPLTAVKKTVPVDLLRPSKLISHANKLIVFDDQTDNLFKVFSLPDVNYQYSFGAIGQGPDDFLFIDKEAINDGTSLEIANRNELVYLNLADTGALQVSRTGLLFVEDGLVNGLKKINDSVYISDNYTDDHKKALQRVNIRTNEKMEFGEVPHWNKNMQTFIEKKREYAHAFCVNRKSGACAEFYYHYPTFRLFSNENKLIKTVTINVDKLSGDTNDKCMFFVEPCATDHAIYVMWINKSKRAVENDLDMFKPNLLVFDWEGNLRGNYQLDQPIISFTVAGNKLYAPSFLETNVIYAYDLPALEAEADTFKRLSSTYFSFDIFDSYNFPQNETPNFDGCRKQGDFLMNVVYLAQGNNHVYDLESISIAGYFPSHPGLTINDFLKYLKERKQVEPVSCVMPLPFEWKGRKFYPIESVYKTQKPKEKKEFLLYSINYVFELDGNFIIWGVCAHSQEVLDRYRDDFLYMASSVSLNRKTAVL